MEEIIALKNKHINNTSSQLKELLQDHVKFINHVKNKLDQHSTEAEKKVENLTSKLTSLKEILQSENQALDHQKHDLSEHLEYVKELEAERIKFYEENHLLETKRNKLRTCKPNIQDQALLDQGRKKYKLYKELTRIRWDYEALKENVKGYVSNRTDYIHHFSYEEKDSKLSDLLWQEIYQSTVRKENT